MATMTREEFFSNPHVRNKVDELELSVRSATALFNDDVKYVGELALQATNLKLPNFADKSRDEVKEVLDSMGLELGTDIEGMEIERPHRYVAKLPPEVREILRRPLEDYLATLEQHKAESPHRELAVRILEDCKFPSDIISGAAQEFKNAKMALGIFSRLHPNPSAIEDRLITAALEMLASGPTEGSARAAPHSPEYRLATAVILESANTIGADLKDPGLNAINYRDAVNRNLRRFENMRLAATILAS